MEIICKTLPNWGVAQTQLSQSNIAGLWQAIEEAKKNKINMKKDLAGNIHSSLKLDVNSEHLTDLMDYVLPTVMNKYNDTYSGPPVKFLSSAKVGNECRLVLDSLWVNFQKKHEFNPIHDHGGALSFVIWMKVPVSSKEQNELPIAKDSNASGLISNFSFVYNDILGRIRTYPYQLDKSVSGYLVMFPSSLMHQVYPYFNSDENRISISGNIALHWPREVQQEMKKQSVEINAL